jgi:two-component system, chemotaxis family, chemotaxis protein CheY
MTNPVLLVDDHEDARNIVRRYLELSGYSVTTAIHGEDALDKIAKGVRPCLILLDVSMPVMDGPTFAERLRRIPDRDLAETPIVLLTGSFDTHSAQSRSRAVDVIHKPVSFDQMTRMVDRHCRPLERS